MTTQTEKSTLSIKSSEFNNVNVLEVEGSLDAFTAESLESKIGSLFSSQKFDIAIGLQDLNYISSAGLGVFMSYIEDIRDKGGDIKLYGLSDKIYRIFDLLGFPLIFNIEKTKEECLSKFEVAN